MIRLENLSYTYSPGTPFELRALQNLNLEIQEGVFLGIIGHTGSGKSTLIQHLNGLLQPTDGRVLIDGQDIWEKGADRKQLRQQVGLVFQYPEHQLFEETVALDVAFGPKNLGLPADEISQRVEWALAQVGLDVAQIGSRSPFELSGGQRRRVAIAGVLAMRPRILVLDEPTAGLDPRGREEVFDLIRGIHEAGSTVVLVSHSMEDVGRLVSQIVVMSRGDVVLSGTPAEVFEQDEMLESLGLGVPQSIKLVRALEGYGITLPKGLYKLTSLAEALNRSAKEAGSCSEI